MRRRMGQARSQFTTKLTPEESFATQDDPKRAEMKSIITQETLSTTKTN